VKHENEEFSALSAMLQEGNSPGRDWLRWVTGNMLTTSSHSRKEEAMLVAILTSLLDEKIVLTPEIATALCELERVILEESNGY
jgi:hypothetical protein